MAMKTPVIAASPLSSHTGAHRDVPYPNCSGRFEEAAVPSG
jgi:hypothetical protein